MTKAGLHHLRVARPTRRTFCSRLIETTLHAVTMREWDEIRARKAGVKLCRSCERIRPEVESMEALVAEQREARRVTA